MSTLLFILATIGLVGIDQFSKHLAIVHLANGNSIELIPGVVELHYLENRGVAFGMLQDMRWVFIPVSLLMMAFLILLLLRSPMRRQTFFRFCCYLCLAGAVGNLIDRAVLGFVVDFLYFRLIDFPVFNVADCYVVVSAILLCVYFLFFADKDLVELPMRTLLFGIPMKAKEQNDG